MNRKKIKWQTVVDVKSDLLFLSTNPLGLKRKYIKKALDIDYEYKTLYYFDNTVAYSEEDLGNFFVLVQKKLAGDRNYLFSFPSRTYKITDDLLEYSRQIQQVKSFRRHSNSELENFFSGYIKRIVSTFPLLLIVIPIEIIVTGELEKYVKKKLRKLKKSTKFEEYYEALTQRATKETFFQEDYRSLLGIGREIQQDRNLLKKLVSRKPIEILNYIKKNKEKLYKKLEDHNKKYSWINMYMFRRYPLNLRDQVNKLKDVLEKDCARGLRNLREKKEKREAAFVKAIYELEIRGELKRKTEVLGEYLYLRTYRLDVFTLSAYFVRDLLLEIASRLKVSYDELVHMAYWEIDEVLLGSRSISDIPIRDRMKEYAFIQIDGKPEIIVDRNRLKRLREEKEKKAVKKVKTIKGSVASRGKAIGPAKIVMHPTQIIKVKKGDVLVAPMTSPDFVMGMLKAVAIVTDHGGITCHAAIVSRELGVPCVVGTKIATKVFKDGDLVEVDADKGVVKKLKK